MDYYNTLGVSKDASEDDIKKAYRKLAMKHHPDRTGGDDSKFKEIQEAYATLSDPEKRSQYDNPRPQFGGTHHGGFNEMPPGFEDIFGQMFGGRNPFGFAQQPRPVKNRDIALDTQITLEDAYIGKTLTANVQLPSGRDQLLEIKIPPGIQSGQRLRLSGMGDDSNPHLHRGDIYINVHIYPHREYERHGDDLHKQIKISAWDAMLGTDMTIKTLDNRQLSVTVPAGTQPNSTLRLAGYGMPNVQDIRFRGNILLNIDVSIPMLTEEQKNIVKQLSV